MSARDVYVVELETLSKMTPRELEHELDIVQAQLERVEAYQSLVRAMLELKRL